MTTLRHSPANVRRLEEELATARARIVELEGQLRRVQVQLDQRCWAVEATKAAMVTPKR